MKKSCRQCAQQFEITTDDLVFHDKVSPVFAGKKQQISPPTLCPSCREQRRMAFRNERKLYLRKCDLCGKQMVTTYSPDKKFTVYCSPCWWSDKWDPLAFAREYDFSRTFFDQYRDLQQVVPRLGMLSILNENSDYTNCVSNLKDCYLIFSSDFSRDCMHGTWYEYSNSCVDNYAIDHCELTYGSFFSNKLYNCRYAVNSSSCIDSSFLFDCRGCSNCYMSCGLRNKQYCIENKPYTQEEYEEKMKQFDLGSAAVLENEKKKFTEMVGKYPRLFMYRNGRIENSTGDFLTDVSNCENCYEVLRGKDCKNVHSAFDMYNTEDCSFVSGSWGYENCECVPMPVNSAFNLNSYGGADIYYTDTCMNDCNQLFGCVSLKHKKFCILNKQYSEEEYNKLMPRIIEKMGKDGEWGEYFDISLSPFGYNETVADEFFRITSAQAKKMGASWKEDEPISRYDGAVSMIPDNIRDTTEKILKEILACGKCGKNFKIIAKEFELYKNMNVAIPRNCPDCRHLERLEFRNAPKLYAGACAKCKAEVRTTYAPDRPETVYCEKCYLIAVY